MRMLLVFALTLVASTVARADDWDAVLERARGETVYFNAWGGSDAINAYIDWVGARVHDAFGIDLVHVKLADTAEAVARVVAEKEAGRDEGGTVDLVWINGENFASMRRQDLLFGPFAQDLPSFALVDTKGKPTTLIDFTMPTDGYESPWGMAQFVLIHDTTTVIAPPRSIDAIGSWISENPGRFTYPAPPDFVGSTFLKHVLLESVDHPERLQRPPDPESFAMVSAPLWSWLEAVRPHLWRQGRTFPASGPALHQLLDDGEVDFSMAFNPAEASLAIASGQMPETVRTFVLDDGTIGNTHFVAIPFNAAHPHGAMVVADFLLSPEAQARKQHPDVWGDGTVLDVGRLSIDDRARFDALPRGIATLSPEALGPVRLEPHPEWMSLIEKEWLRRFSS